MVPDIVPSKNPIIVSKQVTPKCISKLLDDISNNVFKTLEC